MILSRLQALPTIALAFGLAVRLSGCTETVAPRVDYDEFDPVVYSQHIQPVFQASCNAAFCHNASDASLGLSLVSYQSLQAGSRFGAMVTPFKPELSHLYLHLTGAIEPVMPLGRGPLPEDAVRMFRRWIEDGARDDLGRVMYSSVTRKAFVACQGENAVAVVDLDTGLLARVLDVNQPHSVYVHPPTRELFVSRFQTAEDNLHVYDADTYELKRTGRAGTYPALMTVTPDGRQLWVTNFGTFDHKVRVFDPATLIETDSFEIPNAEQPHGLAMTRDGSTVYVTNILTDNVSVYGTTPAPHVITPTVELPDVGSVVGQQPQQCVLSLDGSRLFVSALFGDCIHVMDTTDQSWAEPVSLGDGVAPWHIALSPDGRELWVANWIGESVSIVNVTDPDAAYEDVKLAPPHPEDPERHAIERPIGISFSPDGRFVYVANANDDGEGAGHHPPPDGQKNPGSLTVFDAATRQVVSVAEVPNFARFVSLLP